MSSYDDPVIPHFIDVEASGFGPDSYPIAVAWNLNDGTIERLLIKPSSVPQWTHWSDEAQAVHGLDRDRLERNGWDAAYVADRLREDLNGLTVYSDAERFDSEWLRRLFVAVDQPLPFVVSDFEDLFIAEHRHRDELEYQVVLRYEALREKVAAMASGRHDAGYDVGALIQMWNLSHGRAVKMNHGIGKLPDLTETGTFKAIKLRSFRGP